MKAPEDLYAALYYKLRADGVRIEDKSQYWYWRLIDTLLTVVSFGAFRTFMTRYVTVLGNRIGVPSDWDSVDISKKYAVLLHESKHIEQYRKAGFGNVWLGTVLVGVLYVFLPLPVGLAWFRAYYEKQAYKETIRAYVQCYGRDYATLFKQRIVDYFVTSDYFYMWPFKKHLEQWFDSTLDQVCKEEGL